MVDEYIEDIDVTPDKKILESISSDIDLNKGIKELVDNAIDEYKLKKNKEDLEIKFIFDCENGSITYSDNAGGIKEENLNMVIKPGGTLRKPEEVSIGEFGVGLKRAIIAISKDTEIITRFNTNDTFKIKVDDSWSSSTNWKIPKYKTDQIEECSTIIKFNKIKPKVDLEKVREIKEMIAETYCYIISDKVKIQVGSDKITPIMFNGWAYPPSGRHPRTYKTFISTDLGRIYVDITVGLMLKSSQKGEYGFDIYCNDRLILKNYQDSQIGFRASLLGSPHPSKAWFRSIIRMNGPNTDMPWNSTKSGLNFSHPVISSLIDNIIKLSKPYVQLSRRLHTIAEQEIAKYPNGKIEVVDLTSEEKLQLNPQDVPSLPPGRRSQAEILLIDNKDQIKRYPWTRGLIENVYVADLLFDKRLENKNRFALILLDSCLEIAFKDYIFHVKNLKIKKEEGENLKYRKNLHSIVKNNSNLSEDDWKSVDYFYKLRCSLYHEVSTPEITDTDIENFRELVSNVLEELHDIIV